MELYAQLAQLRKMSSLDLRKLWIQTFGKEPPAAYSVSLLATRLATYFKKKEGGAAESDTDLLESFLQTKYVSRKSYKQYFPKPGTTRSRYYKGKEHIVNETRQGFEYDGKLYKSYSAIASEITGQRRSGLIFFGLHGTRKGASR
ncbi:hypothetical protein AGMMS49949_03140 [Alphaproteobacteria bacterium]|nr:hypothetical protein AGMMS49949_03140 [Alphaproteobacteria bacterium]